MDCATADMGQGKLLTCREFVEFLQDYLSGALPPETLERFNAHLAACPSCVSFAKSYEEAVRIGRSAFGCGDDPVRGVPEDLVRAILDARRSSS